MPSELTIALAQMNCLVGDISGNVDKIIELAATARREHAADLVVFPELAITGYPPEDLLLRPEFIERCEAGLERIRRAVGGIAVLVGFPHLHKGGLYNAAAVLRDGDTLALYHKLLLPNYSVFDEKRYFRAGTRPAVFELQGVQIGLTVCEDIWGPAPMAQAVRAGAQMSININASPFHVDKQAEREAVIRERIAVSPVPVVYVNMVGGQDELVFDGGSLVMDAQGRITQRAPAFEEGLYLSRFRVGRGGVEPLPDAVAEIDDLAGIYQALVTGVRDYIGKNRFAGAIVGLSGGIDSALTVAIAADALGPERVHAVMMPSPYTSDMSLEDARAEAQALGVHYSTISIAETVDSIERALADEFKGTARDATEENIQARVRGVLLMALSNKTGKLVLTTGNKTEMAVGYATLYGDMAGGFAVIKDVPKLLVYRLSHYRNTLSAVIPERVLTRPPSAELRPNQTDQDSLPPYDMLDAILELYIEQDRSAEDIARATGASLKTIREVIAMVTRNEYKRRQAAPGVRISQRAFGRDRRYPITSGFREPRGG
jgi:NAD+ synthase (glutamine-hydrolysing)